jgi:hypothetical protein
MAFVFETLKNELNGYFAQTVPPFRNALAISFGAN